MPEIPQFILERGRANAGLFTADEVAAWPPGLLDQLVASGVLRAEKTATTVVCDACGDDHLEVVQYIESPPGTGLRAYIACPQAGRVCVPMERLRQWGINMSVVTIEPPTGTGTVVSIAGHVPHALAVAHAQLVGTLQQADDLYRRTLRFPNPRPVLDAIERFVHELELIPSSYAELERRSRLVERHCVSESPYGKTRSEALRSHSGTPSKLCPARLALSRVRSASTQAPQFLQEIVDVRRSVESLLADQTAGLSTDAVAAFGAWRDECRTIQLEAERLHVDGCWYLLRVYQSAGSLPTEEAQVARAMLQTDMGGSHLGELILAAESLLAWTGQRTRPTSDAESGNGGVEPKGTRAKRESKDTLKSWTQSDLNDKIRQYKAERASTYQDLVQGVKEGRRGAKKAAQKLFGRNAVARALQVKSRAMVTRSPVWQAIADELRIPRGKDRNRKVGKKTGLDIAMEQQASETAQTGLDRAVHEETIRLIWESMSQAAAEPLIEQLQRGQISDDQAREIVNVVKDQKRDQRRQKVPRNP